MKYNKLAIWGFILTLIVPILIQILMSLCSDGNCFGNHISIEGFPLGIAGDVYIRPMVFFNMFYTSIILGGVLSFVGIIKSRSREMKGNLFGYLGIVLLILYLLLFLITNINNIH